jgi:hypothetical protein
MLYKLLSVCTFLFLGDGGELSFWNTGDKAIEPLSFCWDMLVFHYLSKFFCFIGSLNSRE